jgi:hypothetical protein
MTNYKLQITNDKSQTLFASVAICFSDQILVEKGKTYGFKDTQGFHSYH